MHATAWSVFLLTLAARAFAEDCGLPGSQGCSMSPADDRSAMLMVQARSLPEGSSSLPPSFHLALPSLRRNLTAIERATFREEGFVVLRGALSGPEVERLLSCVRTDPLVMGESGRDIGRLDADGRTTRLTLWTHFGSDSFGLLGRSASMARAASELLGGSEPYSSHTKIMIKEPHTGGAWEWHQDFGYWASQGLLQPDKIVSAIVALDRNDRTNGAMKVMRRSHTLGKLPHDVYGGQAGADPELVLAAAALPGFDVVSLLLEPGDVAFTHSNLLHASAPNLSDRWRRNVIIVYNARDNEPLSGGDGIQPAYNPIRIVADTALLGGNGCSFLDEREVGTFLGQRKANEGDETTSHTGVGSKNSEL